MAATLALSAGGARAGGILGPTSIAVGFGSVWVGMGNGEIVRLDARTGDRQARFRGAPTSFVHGLVAAYGAVWAVRSRVVRVDPRRNTVREVRGFGSATAFAIRRAARALWVADDGSNEVVRIRAGSGELAARVAVPGRAFGLATGDRDVLSVSAPTNGPITGPSGVWLIRRIDPATNRISSPLVRLDCYPAMAIARDAVWTADECSGSLTRRDPQTLAATGSLSLSPAYRVPVSGFGALWLIGPQNVLRIDPDKLAVVATIRARGVAAAVGAGGIWVLDMGNGVRGSVRMIDPATNRIARVFKVSAKP